MTSRAAAGLAVALAIGACGAGQRAVAQSACPQDRVVELGLQDDAAAIARCERVAGLRIRTGAQLDLSALALREIDGDLEIGPTVAIDAVVLNTLVHVRGAIRVASNGSLRGIYLPMLETAGSFQVTNNPVLMTVSVPRLGGVGGAFELVGNNALETVIATTLKPGSEPRRIEGNPHLPADVLEALRAGSPSP